MDHCGFATSAVGLDVPREDVATCQSRRHNWTLVAAARGGRRPGRGGRRRPSAGRSNGGGGPSFNPALVGMEPIDAIRRQVEYYFCDENLASDKFLQQHMDSDGFCELSIIATFARVRTFAVQAKRPEDPRPITALLAEALAESGHVEVADTARGISVRRIAKYSVKDIGGGLLPTKSSGAKTGSDQDVRGAPCKYHFAGYCDRGSRCPNSHSMAYCDAIVRQWMNPVGSGPSSRTQPLVDRLKKVTASLGLTSPSLSYASRMVRTSLPVSAARTLGSRQKFDYFVVVDLEGRDEIIEFPAIIFSARQMREVGRFHRWVRPVKLWRGKKINPESDSVEFDQVLREFDHYLKELGLLGASGSSRFAMVCCGDWDVKTQIPKQCKLCGIEPPQYMRRWINIKDIFNRVYVSKSKATGMKAILHRMGLVDGSGGIQGVHHLGMHDTENIARILLRLLEEKAELVYTGELS